MNTEVEIYEIIIIWKKKKKKKKTELRLMV